MAREPSAAQVSRLPKTFNDRGLSLQFTSDAIGYARLRRPDGQHWEALIPGLSGGKGTYVIPWKQIPELFSLTMHDRALHEQLSQLNELSPYHVRKLFLELESEGYAGADAAEAAMKEMEKEKETTLLTHYTLVMKVLSKLGRPGETAIQPSELTSSDGQDKIKKQMEDFAVSKGLRPQQVMDIMEEWAALVSAVGSLDGKFSGYLTETIVELNSLTQDLKEWSQEEPAEIVAMATRISEAAIMTGDLAFKMKAEIIFSPDDFETILTNWDVEKKKIEDKIAKLSWILDGWQKILKNWLKAQKGFRYEQRQMVEETVQFIPTLPQEALNVSQTSIFSKIKEFQSRFVRVNVNWLTDEVDPEMMDRIGGYPMEDF